MFDLSGKSVLITGSSRGIGLAAAGTLARCGARVALHCRKPSTASAIAWQMISAIREGCISVYGDLSTGEGVEALWDSLKAESFQPDILILNASVQVRCTWSEIDRDEFDLQMHTNFFSTLQLIQMCVPHMSGKHWGRIVTVGSTQQCRPHEQMAVYAASKAAQENLVRNLARQLAPDGITVNNIAPGTICTDRNMDVLSNEEYHKRCRDCIPAGFIGKPEDCAGAILLLCSEESRYITGTNLYIDGGKHL